MKASRLLGGPSHVLERLRDSCEAAMASSFLVPFWVLWTVLDCTLRSASTPGHRRTCEPLCSPLSAMMFQNEAMDNK